MAGDGIKELRAAMRAAVNRSSTHVVSRAIGNRPDGMPHVDRTVIGRFVRKGSKAIPSGKNIQRMAEFVESGGLPDLDFNAASYAAGQFDVVERMARQLADVASGAKARLTGGGKDQKKSGGPTLKRAVAGREVRKRERAARTSGGRAPASGGERTG